MTPVQHFCENEMVQPDWLKLLNASLDEDLYLKDVTSRICSDFFHSKDINPRTTYEFTLSNREPIMFSGKNFLAETCSEMKWDLLFVQEDGASMEPGEMLLKARAPLFTLLSTERTILNILQHICGVTTKTAASFSKIQNTYQKWSDKDREDYKIPKLLHTRKTLPGLRAYEVYACQVGGASVHRLELQSRAMFKDNHKEILSEHGSSFSELKKWGDANNYKEVLDNAIFEADTIEEAQALYDMGARNLLLDNFSPDELRAAIPKLPGAVLEASGGLNKGNIESYVIPGIHRLSIGALTHSAVSVDIGLDIIR